MAPSGRAIEPRLPPLASMRSRLLLLAEERLQCFECPYECALVCVDQRDAVLAAGEAMIGIFNELTNRLLELVCVFHLDSCTGLEGHATDLQEVEHVWSEDHRLAQ